MEPLSAFKAWLRRLRRAGNPHASTPAIVELLDGAAVNVETVCDRVRVCNGVRASQVEVGLNPDWADLLARVEHANESLRRAIDALGVEQAAMGYGSIETRPMSAGGMPTVRSVGPSLSC
jgi:hypothetical protein